mgnify:CR=1 FL=1
MKNKLIVSLLLLTLCYTGLSQDISSPTIKNHSSAVTVKGLIKVSIMYPFSENIDFDMEYYETKHMPMVAGYLGSNLKKDLLVVFLIHHYHLSLLVLFM